MTRLARWFGSTATIAGLLAGCASAWAHSGHTIWGAWTFDWEVKDDAGIAIRNVYYNNEFVIWKASMPVIRVRYANDGCGPYADRISWGSLLDIGNCNNVKVCQTSFTANGRNWLELGVLAAIGSYRLYQVWYLSADGWIACRLWSRGLQCNLNHQHHPYWRLDSDINGAASDQAFVYDKNRPNEGWGNGWHKYTIELNDRKSPATSRVWFVRDNPTGHGLWVYPDPNGSADQFSVLDVAVRRYRYSEDEAWPFGAWGDVGYGNGESVQEQDNVLWYVSHLEHHAAEGGDQWHAGGPNLLISR